MMAAMGSGRQPLVQIEDGRSMVLERTRPLDSEAVSLADAAGRFLTEPVASDESVPAFDNSAMDGYAVRSADLGAATAAAPIRLTIAGESRAGHPAAVGIGPGEAIAISTGAVIPDGADAVVKVEDTSCEGEAVAISEAVSVDQNVRRAGDDIEPGAELLAPGRRLGPAELGVLASIGRPQVRCGRRPTISMLSTGDELIGPDEQMREGAVRNSNAITLPALARAAGAGRIETHPVADSAEATREAIAAALDASDVLILSGGVSVGEHDHVKGALAELGVERVFWGVSLKPGKPTLFGTRGETLVFGLPGNPVSSFVTFLLFVRPALIALQGGDPELARVRGRARLATELTKPTDRAHAVRVRLSHDERGLLAHPFAHQGSHVLTSMLEADALALIDESTARVEAGEMVTVELIR